MNEEYPDHGPGGQGQDLDTERAPVTAAPAGETPRPAAEPPPTGDDQVDAALAGLSRLPGAPAEEHVAVLEEVHGRLRDILGELSEDTP